MFLNFVWGRPDSLPGYILLISPLKVPHWNVCDISSSKLKLEMLNSKTTGGAKGIHKSKCCYSAAIINMSGLKHFIVQITVMADWIRWLQYFWELLLVIICSIVYIMNWLPHVNNTCWGCKNGRHFNANWWNAQELPKQKAQVIGCMSVCDSQSY